ncbi:hypothetical protein M885DRAFT_537503 [Pelagophyceae sp. CCMP2097]|nr:hypothetical protein M885DRAFT_537503 [Pelagophyceae sp. CCMP2097]
MESSERRRRPRGAGAALAAAPADAFDRLRGGARAPFAFDADDEVTALLRAAGDAATFEARRDSWGVPPSCLAAVDEPLIEGAAAAAFAQSIPRTLKLGQRWMLRPSSAAGDRRILPSYWEPPEGPDAWPAALQPEPDAQAPLARMAAHFREGAVVGLVLTYEDGVVRCRGAPPHDEKGAGLPSQIVFGGHRGWRPARQPGASGGSVRRQVADAAVVVVECKYRVDAQGTNGLRAIKVSTATGDWDFAEYDRWDDTFVGPGAEYVTETLRAPSGEALWDLVWAGAGPSALITKRPEALAHGRDWESDPGSIAAARSKLCIASLYDEPPDIFSFFDCDLPHSPPTLFALARAALEKAAFDEAADAMQSFDADFAARDAACQRHSVDIFAAADRRVLACRELETLQRVQAVATAMVKRATYALEARVARVANAAKLEFDAYTDKVNFAYYQIMDRRRDAVDEVVERQAAWVAGIPSVGDTAEPLRMCRLPACRRLFVPSSVPLAKRCRHGDGDTANSSEGACRVYYCGCENLRDCPKCDLKKLCPLCWECHSSPFVECDLQDDDDSS